MSNPSTPNFSGMGAMTDTLDFVKNLWSGMGVPGMSAQGKGMGIPGMIMPSLSVEEINKQIADLKAVESWLTLNMNMLRSTIQALEVQSATIATLQSMSASFSAAAKSATNLNPAGKAASAAPAAAKDEPAATAQPAEPPKSPEPPPSTATASTKATDAAAPLGNPAMWWNMLQDQFNQAVNAALASEKPVAPVKAASSKVSSEKPQTSKSVKAAAAKKASTPSAKKAPKTPVK
ncbi:MAG TPA: PhaM family polyhydroxyalkanoate granule multifunctional regulatory protein [Burkholderiaceae bacterium]|jgi:hypothetical protein|nr:PhaM family polyhydroxyalkanoate granule multifunctional regulatory protein [Burkholderiaceae bacterium]